MAFSFLNTLLSTRSSFDVPSPFHASKLNQNKYWLVIKEFIHIKVVSDSPSMYMIDRPKLCLYVKYKPSCLFLLRIIQIIFKHSDMHYVSLNTKIYKGNDVRPPASKPIGVFNRIILVIYIRKFISTPSKLKRQ